MRVHADWATAAFERPPAAAHVGPFPRRPFLEAWWKARGTGEPALVETDTTLLPLRHGPAGVEFLGEPDLTDYHVPLGTESATAAAQLSVAFGSGTAFRLDSLPGEVAGSLRSGLEAAGAEVSCRQHAVAAVIDLPGDYDTYLGGLTGKQRHEVRRKRRRFEESLGTPRIERDASPEAFDAFVDMHRSAPGDKARFMTEGLEGFFGTLLGLDDAVLDVLVGNGNTAVAAAFGFEDDQAYYLYNSAYLTDAADASPGVVLLDRLVSAAIDRGRSRFDFLKGDERYKFKSGAYPRPLFVLEGVL